MASNYGIPDEDDIGKKEFFDEEKELSSKLDLLAKWVQESRHFIIFTGAGISTSTGIPDFRSGMDTVLSTGPGVWELRDKGIRKSRASKTKTLLQAVPSVAHMAIVQLQRKELVQFVVSQNTDGLHLRSGLDAEYLAELHGNTNLETCRRCHARYLRDFRTRNARGVHNHFTGRFCDNPKCRGKLADSIVNFGEDLPKKALEKSFAEAREADLCLVLGSSLRVTPASEIPEIVASKGQRLVICNLQKTPLHSIAALVIHAMCDNVMIGLMKRLELDIPGWELQRRTKMHVKIAHLSQKRELSLTVSIAGLANEKDIPYSFVSRAIFSVSFQKINSSKTVSNELFSTKITLPYNILMKDQIAKVSAELFFHSRYEEPSLLLSEMIPLSSKQFEREYKLFFNPSRKEWRVTFL